MTSYLRGRFAALHDHLGTAGLIIAVVALVAALTGGAIAANGGASSSKTKVVKGPRGPKGAKGAPGAPGATGPAGAAGAAGKDGLNGLDGEDGKNGATGATGPTGPTGATGANGKTVLSGTVPPTTQGVDGDFYIDTAANKIYGPKAGTWPAGVDLKGPKGDKGDEGSPWTFGGVLPPGKTETGSWITPKREANHSELEPYLVAFSFSIPLNASIEAANVHFINKGASIPAGCENSEHAGTAGPTNPEAAKGHFCVYQANTTTAFEEAFGPFSSTSAIGEKGASQFGAYIEAFIKEGAAGKEGVVGGSAYGTWAVTAP